LVTLFKDRGCVQTERVHGVCFKHGDGKFSIPIFLEKATHYPRSESSVLSYFVVSVYRDATFDNTRQLHTTSNLTLRKVLLT